MSGGQHPTGDGVKAALSEEAWAGGIRGQYCQVRLRSIIITDKLTGADMADTGHLPGSPAHQSSGSSTNPNTPRSATPDEPRPANDEPTEAESSPKSSSSGERRRYDIEPTWPKEFDITKTPAIASWEDHRLPNLLLDIHWHQRSGKAFFTLRTTVLSLKGPGRRGGKTSIYLFIYPERIRKMSIDPNPTQKTFGFETLEMHFDMNRAPALVLPKTPCEPKTRAAKDVMAVFVKLATQTSFVIHAGIPRKKLSIARMRELCTAASSSGLISLDAHANTTRLYQGQGGRIVEGESIEGDATGPAADDEPPPPQYSEPSSAGPPAAYFSDGEFLYCRRVSCRVVLTSAHQAAVKGKKRRRTSSSSPEPTEPTSHKALQALLDASLSSLKQHFDDRLDAHKREVAELLGRTEARILDTLRSEMDQLSGETLEVLEDRIHQGMAEVEENVMRNISEAPLQATLTFPQHPWY